MSKSLAIAVALCLVGLSVSDVEAGLFGRRSGGCRGGNCSVYSAPAYTQPTAVNKPVTASQPAAEVRAASPTTEVKAPAPGTTVTPVSQQQNGSAVQSPSDLPINESVPAAPPAVQSSPCAGGNCYVPTYSSPCANGRCSSRGWFRR